MEIKNVEEMRKAFPDLVAQLETAARNEGANAERARISGIEDIQNAIGNPEMVKNAKFGENPLTAQQLAFEAMKAQAAIGANVLNGMNKDTANSGVDDVEGNPTLAGEPNNLTEDEEAENLLIGAIPANMKKEGK
jgi:hypothetical protein